MVLLPKKGDLRTIENWRPVSLLCTDYKIIAKAIANRLKAVAGRVIGQEQTYSIPGRTIHNIGTVRDVISLARIHHTNSGLIFMDQEKAFDRVDHGYLEKLLSSVGFGPIFTAQVKLLYADIQSTVKINQRLGRPFPVTRGSEAGMSPLRAPVRVVPGATPQEAENHLAWTQLPGSRQSELEALGVRR